MGKLVLKKVLDGAKEHAHRSKEHHKRSLLDQGNIEHYTDDAQAKRELVFHSEEVQVALDHWWAKAIQAGEVIEEKMNFKGYRKFWNKVFKHHGGDSSALDSEEIKKALHDDWVHDKKGHTHLDKYRFKMAIFVLADHWVNTTHAHDYQTYLEVLLNQIY